MTILNPYFVFVESQDATFDTVGLFETLKEVAVGKVWNFLTGAYLLKSELGLKELSSLLEDESYPSHIVLAVDPARTEGHLPEPAWDSFFLDIFGDDLEDIGRAKGWNVEHLRQIKAEHVKSGAK